MQQLPEVIFIAGPCGSGTSALAAALLKLGVTGFGPWFETNDPRTPNAFESMHFRDLILRHCDEPTISLKMDASDALIADLENYLQRCSAGEFGNWNPEGPRRLMLKFPLASICIPELIKSCSAKVVVMQRPLSEIENTRQRRGWPAHMGASGAEYIYHLLADDLRETGCDALHLSFSRLRAEPESTLRKLTAFCELGAPGELEISEAAALIRR